MLVPVHTHMHAHTSTWTHAQVHTHKHICTHKNIENRKKIITIFTPSNLPIFAIFDMFLLVFLSVCVYEPRMCAYVCVSNATGKALNTFLPQFTF